MTDDAQSPSFTMADVTAVPESAAQVRHRFSDWLDQNLALDAVKASDVVLAVNEALANAAEFAYLSAPQPGVMHVHADYDPAAAILTVIVADQGRWRISESQHNNASRGRGIPLMRALCDRAVIDSTSAGTRVCLQWDGIRTPALRHAEAGPPEQRTDRSAEPHS
ncbi:ATP-binding protein [Mycolicibacterium mageritense]|uniref:Anti-sigma regulatory factor n=1 Tax=Mycolicibacterium mageritense TaxID=53462 RepID=A0ABM7HTU3_MYCME|nr:ATP-binding protein [Mycolicibacterium mageritense]MCC9181337.1 ATP-binding protein [Mycolicibacterium mageritense]TXI65218.1 MAG: ATP-binding protein [Mycolicibacterium mageritense]CDO22401.1 putative anti-sigma regulatory factor [Mycolicibacterium mageritense DSM 44476 = CIP 104973]BBX33982.1 anti-sigma regulatory factor [Mycolicibacterium mageritense]GJJ20142.1 anti-sigma regulatory factor [Mycolicibacterium mageritense]